MHHKKELQELMRTYSSMKALQLLVALADCEGEISLAQLSAATGIPPSSTHRILQEMQHCGFVIPALRPSKVFNASISSD